MDKVKAPRILIWVEGVLVRGVNSDSEHIDVDIVDIDNLEVEEDEDERKRIEQLREEFKELPYTGF